VCHAGQRWPLAPSGVPQSDIEAVKWYRAAAENGASDALYAMGQFYMFGRGVDRDPSIATSWWQKAAEKGYPPALHNLGIPTEMA
jgi:TPR repeat protein